MKKLIPLSMLLALSAQANVPLVPHCPKEFHQEATRLGAKDLWVEQAPSPEGYQVFRTPTENFGQWLEVAFDNKHTTLYSISNASLNKVSFDGACHAKATHEKGFDARAEHPDVRSTWIDDKRLAEIMKESPEGLIYVWSPGMMYSVEYYHRFEEVAKEMGLKFVPVLDHRASGKELAELGKKMPVPPASAKLNSVELYMRNVTTHFPGSLVFKNGQLNQNRIIGVMEKSQLQNTIKQELESL